ncbi:MAG: PhzF family phenazine biosynthesis isomerase [Synergistaceae bacterium]|nr:PhzF family phenazine biosynthesis isomerase [Synergistaceae bacterium]
MKKYDYKKVDAFTSNNSLGNPAACVYLNEGQSLAEDEMLSIAKQHKGFVSEVVYCTNNGSCGFDLAYYSSECEVPFCGHGTIACMYSLIKDSPELLKQSEIIIHTRTKGSLIIYNKITEQDAVYISAPEPVYSSVPISLEAIIDCLSVDISAISDAYPVDFIDAGNRTLIIPIRGLEDEINIFPNEQTLKEFSLNNGIDVILIFCTEVMDEAHFAHTRVFAAKYGYLEDPATGSANSAFGYYLLKNNMWDGNPITLEQGGIDRIFNTVNLFHKDNRIFFGGKATTRIEGVYYI